MVLRKSRFGGMSKNVKIGGIIVVVVVSFIVIFIIYKTILRLKEQKKIDKKWKEILKERAIYDEKMSEREKENIRYMNEESPIKATQAEYDAEIKENDLLIKDKYKTQLITSKDTDVKFTNIAKNNSNVGLISSDKSQDLQFTRWAKVESEDIFVGHKMTKLAEPLNTKMSELLKNILF